MPFTILTGFLGAGKTTVLNRMLAAPHGRRIAVLVNELGRIAIDGRLILSRGGDVLELAGGCVCCKIDVKNDLWDGIADVIRRSAPEHVVLETTGIAEPAAIIEGLERLPAGARDRIDLAGIVCVVDAEAGAARLDRRDEIRAQIEIADRLLLSKLDVTPAAGVEALHARLRQMNPDAELASFPSADDGTVALTHWVLGHLDRTRRAPARLVHAHRDGQLVAASFVEDAPLLAGPVMALIDALGDNLLRAKGFLHLAGEPRRAFLEVAGVRSALRFDREWGSEPRRTELVLIGENLDEAALRRQLWACRAAAELVTPAAGRPSP
ncbi:MAG TPA: GTP-binding protein [Haliangium sp.]|nr:GTP-binding protein [Haliangium sp.]